MGRQEGTTARERAISLGGFALRSVIRGAAFFACFAVSRIAHAGEGDGELARIVVRYDAPPECPGADGLAAAVRAELANRRWDDAHPLQVRVTVSRSARGYESSIVSTDDGEAVLERSVRAPTCDEVTDIAAAIIALAQSERPPEVIVERAHGPAPPPPPETTSGLSAPTARAAPGLGAFEYAFTLGYGAFAAGPADPVIWSGPERTTFNPAQGVRLGFDVTHAVGAWKHSLHVSAAYYRQSTTSVLEGSYPVVNALSGQQNNVLLSDRDVLLATVDVCPVHLDYALLSLIPCGTFSMMQTQGNSGTDSQLETGLGGTVYLRARWKQFFAEGAGTIVAASDSYEPPSRPFRIFYSVSLGMTLR
jgi:hypothetical protein